MLVKVKVREAPLEVPFWGDAASAGEPVMVERMGEVDSAPSLT